MRKKITIRETAPHQMYIPKDLADEGFVGEADLLANAVTATIVKPGTPLDQVRKSLCLILEDIDIRLEEAKRKATESD